MKYSVVKNNANGSSTVVAEGLSKKEAVAKATEMAASTSGITVEFFRKSDGQHGYLNQDGSHDVTGKHWSAE